MNIIYTESKNNPLQIEFAENLSGFRGISLIELEKLTPARRFDCKYLLHTGNLRQLLLNLIPYFSILDINGDRNFNYSNIYFDTEDGLFYKSHVNGKLGRYKLRLRHYKETDESFVEIKYKNNRNETGKTRFKVRSFSKDAANYLSPVINKIIPVGYDNLRPALFMDYKRITLLIPDRFDKITIDYDLKFRNTEGITSEFPNLVILEHKFTKNNFHSFVPEILKSINSFPESISKFCLGLVLTKPEIKYNRYKSKLLTINKICNGINSKYSQCI